MAIARFLQVIGVSLRVPVEFLAVFTALQDSNSDPRPMANIYKQIGIRLSDAEWATIVM